MLEGKNQWSFIRFRVTSESKSIDDISAKLDMAPTRYTKKGDPVRKRNPNSRLREFNVWVLESALDEQEPFEIHIKSLLPFLSVHRREIEELYPACEFSIASAFAPADGESGGFILGHESLWELATYQLDLSINLYPPEWPDEPDNLWEMQGIERWSSAAFCIKSASKSVGDISARLEFSAMGVLTQWEVYDEKGKKFKPWSENIWILESQLSHQEPIEAHIEYLLSFLERHSEGLERLQPDCQFNIVCRYSALNGQGGFTLDHVALKRLTTYPVNLCVNLYPTPMALIPKLS